MAKRGLLRRQLCAVPGASDGRDRGFALVVGFCEQCGLAALGAAFPRGVGLTQRRCSGRGGRRRGCGHRSRGGAGRGRGSDRARCSGDGRGGSRGGSRGCHQCADAVMQIIEHCSGAVPGREHVHPVARFGVIWPVDLRHAALDAGHTFDGIEHRRHGPASRFRSTASLQVEANGCGGLQCLVVGGFGGLAAKVYFPTSIFAA